MRVRVSESESEIRTDEWVVVSDYFLEFFE